MPLILRDRNVFLIWLGQLLSQAGTRMYQIALLWWIVSTQQPDAGLKAGGFLVAGALPGILFVKLIGRTVDRWDSRRILVVCDLLSCLAVALVGAAAAFSSLHWSLVWAAGFGVALLQAFFDPALNKAVARAAPPEDLEAAVAFQSSTQSLASFGGAAAGALLIDYLGVAGAVWLNAASFLVSALVNAALNLREEPAVAPSRRPESSGWEILGGQPLLKKILLGFGCANFFMTPILVVLPFYVKLALGGGASLLGMLEAALWLGLLSGTFASRGLRTDGHVLELGAACLFIMGACLLAAGLTANGALFGALLFAAGIGLGVNNVKFVALFQTLVAPEWKGRFFAVMQALLSFTFPVAYFLFGLLADFLSPSAAFLIQGAGVMVLSGYFLRLSLSYSEAAPLPEPALAGGD